MSVSVSLPKIGEGSGGVDEDERLAAVSRTPFLKIIMLNSSKNDWKRFYREQYADDWQGFSETLARQPYHLRYQQALLDRVRGAKPGTLLEVGVGRGDLLIQFAKEPIELFGCDISSGNLVAARRRFEEVSVPVSLSHADAERLPFADGAFDVVYSYSVLWYLPSPSQAAAEMCRVTRPGGTVIFDMLNALHITSASYHLSRIIGRCLGKERGRTRLATPAQLRRWIEPFCNRVEILGNYVVLPAGLPLLGEKANLFRLVPGWAVTMTESPLPRLFAQKLLAVGTRGPM